jgi:peptidoglycan/xylan/chitin deacetylase (PgdA/CDA1 family)
LSFSRVRNCALTAGAQVLYWIPGCFGIAKAIGPSCGLRSLVFHNIADADTPFTTGIRATVSPKEFETTLQFLTAHYSPVSLTDVLSDGEGKRLPARPLLLSFDDAYASVYEYAAPLCQKYRVPAVFFVNGSALDNRRLLPDNLICYVASLKGMSVITAAARRVPGFEIVALSNLKEVFGSFLPQLSLAERDEFLNELRRAARVDEGEMAAAAKLYLTSSQLRELRDANFEIGNHTFTHTYCRRLSQTDLAAEIGRNKSELEKASGQKVRAFSQPYGSSQDLVPDVAQHLRASGHRAVFLSESVANRRDADLYHLDRVSTCASDDANLFLDLEVKPRLRAIRNRYVRRTVSGSSPSAHLQSAQV